MRVRAAGIAAGLILTGVAGNASAAPVCNLGVDPEGDTFLARYQEDPRLPSPVYGPQEDSLDIVSADLASDGKVVTAVIRVKNLGAAASTAPTGRGYEFTFLSSKTENILYLRALKASSEAFEVGFKEPLEVGVTTLYTSLGEATGVFDVAKSEVRITAPLSVFDAQGGVKNGDKVTLGEITTGRIAGPRTPFADALVGEKSYKIGDASCVKPGK